MKSLTLQIKREYLDAILDGSKKEEFREIRPNAQAKKYQKVTKDGYEPIVYDQLRLINGRKKNAPEITVKVTECLFEYSANDDGQIYTYMHEGKEYVVVYIVYKLGEIISKKNTD